MGLRQLTAKTVTKTIQLGGGDGEDPLPISITFRPIGWTAALETTYFEALDHGRGANATVEFLLGFVESWDLKWNDSDKKPIPVTKDGLADIDIFTLKGIVDGIQADLMPNPPTPK